MVVSDAKVELCSDKETESSSLVTIILKTLYVWIVISFIINLTQYQLHNINIDKPSVKNCPTGNYE